MKKKLKKKAEKEISAKKKGVSKAHARRVNFTPFLIKIT